MSCCSEEFPCTTSCGGHNAQNCAACPQVIWLSSVLQILSFALDLMFMLKFLGLCLWKFILPFRIMVRGGAMATVVGGMTNASHLLIFQVFQLFFLHFYMMNLFLTYSIHPNRSGPSCSDETVCFDKEVDPIGAKYDGCVNTTVSGRTCQVSPASWGIFQLVVYF